MSDKNIILLAFVVATALLKTGCHQATDQLQFKDEVGGLAIAKDGNELSFHTYKSQDGVTLSTFIETCSSPELAKKAFEEKVKEASSIIARGARLDRNGEYLGERAVLTVENMIKGKVESESFICWTTPSRLHWIQSKSLKHALA